MDQPSGVGVMQGFGDVATSSAESRKDGRACPILTARSLPSTSFETTKQSPSSVRPTSKTGTMLGWSSLARMRASFR